MANEFKHKTVGTVLTQAEWEATDGTGHILDSQATGDIVYASSATVLSRLGVGTDGDLLNLGSGIPAWTSAISTAKTFADNILLGLGTGADGVLLNRSTTLAANTALTGVMIGTPVTPAVAANSLLVSNVTASGDYLLALNNGGNSQAWHWVDSSGGTQTLYAAGVARILLNSTGGSFTGTWSNLGTVTTVDINGGSVDGAAIGAASHSTIKGTTIDATTDFTVSTTVITGGQVATSSGTLVLAPNGTTLATWNGATSGVTSFTAITLDGVSVTLGNGAAAKVRKVLIGPDTAILSGTTQVTDKWKYVEIHALTINQTGGAVTVDHVDTLFLRTPVAGSSVTITNNRVIDTTSGATLTSAGVWTDNPSTRTRKKNIQALTAAKMYAAIKLLRPSEFDYDDEFRIWQDDINEETKEDSGAWTYPNAGDTWGTRYGIIAEELPSFVRGPGDPNTEGVSGSMLAGFALAAVSYLTDRLDRAGVAL